MNGLRPRELLTAASRHRGLLAGGLAAAAVATGLGVLAPAPPTTRTVLSVARDLPGGALLTTADLRAVQVPVALAPAGALTGAPAAVGQLLSGPMRRGEILTDVRTVGAALLQGQPAGLRAVLLRVGDPATAAVVRAGDHVDVLGAATDRSGAPVSGAPVSGAPVSGAPVSGSAERSAPAAVTSAHLVAEDLTVLAVPRPAQDSGEGALLVVAAYPEVARRLAGAAVVHRLSAVVRPQESPTGTERR